MAWRDDRGRTWSECVSQEDVACHDRGMDELESEIEKAETFEDWESLFHKERRIPLYTERSQPSYDRIFEGLFATASSFEQLKKVEWMSHFTRRCSEYKFRIAEAMEPFANTLEEWREILSLTCWPPDNPLHQRAHREFDRLKQEREEEKHKEEIKEKGILWADEIMRAILRKFKGSASNTLRGGWQAFPKITEGLYTEVRVVNRGFTVWMAAPEKISSFDPAKVEADCHDSHGVAEEAMREFSAEYGFVETNGVTEIPSSLAYQFNLPRRASQKFWSLPGHEKEVATALGLQ